MFKGKRVFISGGAGVIGRELVKRLHHEGAELFVGDLKPRPLEWPAEIRYRQGDLNEISTTELLDFDPQYFFHLAATFERSVESYEFWNENDRHNTRLSHHLMDVLKDAPELEKVVFASSYLIYNPELYQFDSPATVARPLKESDPINPRNLCGMSKLLHEMELRFLSEHAPARYQTVSARIYRVYGKNSRDIISRWIQALLNGETIQVYRKEGMFDYIYAGDVAEGLYQLALSNQQGIVNLGNGRARRVEEVLQVLSQHFPDMRMIEGESDIAYEASEADMGRFQSWTFWRPERNLEDTIPELIEHYKLNKTSLVTTAANSTIMISSVSKKVPLVKSVQSAVHKLGLGGEIIGADSSPTCLGRYFTDQFWEMPRLTELPLADFIQYCREKQIGAVIPTRDGELSYYANAREQLASNGISVMVSKPEAVRLCLDKLDYYQFGKQSGFPVILTSESADSLSCSRLVVKERFGAGAINIAINVSLQEAILHAQQLDSPIFQPYVEGTEISADLYVASNGRCKGVVLRRRELIVHGESQVTATFTDAKLEALCAKFAEELGLYGHAVMQLIIDRSGNPHFIECNARLGGASRLSLEMGLDSIYWFLLEAEGVDLQEYPFSRASQEKRLVRYAEDLIL